MGTLHSHFSAASLLLNELIKPQLSRQIPDSDLHYWLSFYHTQRKCAWLRALGCLPAFPEVCVASCVLMCMCGDTGDGQIRLDTAEAAWRRPFVLWMWFGWEVWSPLWALVMGEGTDWQWQWGGNASEWGAMASVWLPPSHRLKPNCFPKQLHQSAILKIGNSYNLCFIR